VSDLNNWDDDGGFVSDEDDDTFDELSEQYHEEQDELNGSDLFRQKYGFDHDCTCANDWDTGNVGLVSVCYLGMVSDALDTLEKVIQDNRALQAEIAQLRIALVEAEQNAS
jgi:hypothetical protein